MAHNKHANVCISKSVVGEIAVNNCAKLPSLESITKCFVWLERVAERTSGKGGRFRRKNKMSNEKTATSTSSGLSIVVKQIVLRRDTLNVDNINEIFYKYDIVYKSPTSN